MTKTLESRPLIRVTWLTQVSTSSSTSSSSLSSWSNFSRSKTKVRDYSTLNTKSFNNDLQNINWTSVCQHTDANQSFSRFYKLINKKINKHASLRRISNRKQKLLAKPWLTAGLRKSIRVKNALFLTSDWDKYKF